MRRYSSKLYKPTYKHDVAKALMQQAGFPNGLPQPIEVLMPSWDNEVKIHEIYTAQLQQIGVQLKPTE
jgi:ABC-type transport system substrate-binding protein